MTALRSVLEVARQTFVLLLRHKMLWVLAVASLIPCAMLLLVPRRAVQEHTGEALYGIVSYFTTVQLGLPFAALFFGIVAVHGDIEDRTSTYLFLRPVRRGWLLLGKWLAATVLCCLAFAVLVGVTWCCAALPHRPWRAGLAPNWTHALTFLGVGLLGAPAYAAAGALAGAWFRRPLLIAMAFLIGWEVVVSNLPPRSGVRSLTIAEPLRSWLVDRFANVDEIVRVLTQGQGLDPSADHGQVATLLQTTAALVLLAMAVYARREYDSRPRD